MYAVEKLNGEELATGNLLDELLELIVFKHIQNIENNTNVLTRLNKGYYQYLNQLSCVYKLSELYAETLELNWEYVELVLDIYNQEKFISKNDFIQIKEVKSND